MQSIVARLCSSLQKKTCAALAKLNVKHRNFLAQPLCVFDMETIQRINPHPSRMETDNLPSTTDLSGLMTLNNIYVNKNLKQMLLLHNNESPHIMHSSAVVLAPSVRDGEGHSTSF